VTGAGAVVVSGAVARRIDCGGHVWALLQWALGFRELGWSVVFLDRLDPAPGLRDSAAIRRFTETMAAFGLADSFSLDIGPNEEPVGLSRAKVLERVSEADLLLNVMGYLEDPELLARARRRVFLDIDPGFGQMWRALGLCDLFRGHDAFVTVGTRVGRDDCRVPTCGLDWITTLPPVVIDRWPAPAEHGTRFTSVGAWRGPWAPVEYEGERYGLRVHEFRRFTAVPRESGLDFEIALDIDPADGKDLEALRQNGWHVVDPKTAAADAFAFRQYVQTSGAECSVAKGIYTETNSGWFSDRTVCYLASGKPALVQETGFSHRYPTGEGLVSFATLDEAAAGAERIARNYDAHCRAARAIAEEHFDSDKVLREFSDVVGISN